MSSQKYQHQKYFTIQNLQTAINKVQNGFYNLNQLYQNILNGGQKNREINKIQNGQNKILLIFGMSSSGKTTLEYYLCEDQLQFNIQEKKKIPYIVPKKVYQNAIIQKTPIAVTSRYPNIRVRTSIQQNNKVILIQVPDIKQLKLQQKPYQYLFLHQVFKSFNSIHLLLTVTEVSFDDVAQFMENFEFITSLFDIKKQQTKQLLSKNLTIIVNKVDPLNQQPDIRQKLQDLNNECIQDENEDLYDIIKQIISDERVYVIKQRQPNEQQQNQQKKLFQNIMKNSNFQSYKNTKVNISDVQQIVRDEDNVKTLILKPQLKNKWAKYIKQFQILVKYLVDEKSRQLNQQIVNGLIMKNQQNYKGQKEQRNKQILPFEGKINNKIKSSLQKCIKYLVKANQQDFQSITLNKIRQHFFFVNKAIYQHLGINLQQQQKIDQNKNTNNSTIQSSLVPYLLTLKSLCTDVYLFIDYFLQILNFNSDSQITEQQIIHKSIISHTKIQLIQIFILKFSQFDLKLFASKVKKRPKQSSPKKRQIKQITIADLRQQLLNQYKKNKKQILPQIMNIPNNHFKIYMLCEQLPQDIKKFDKHFTKNVKITKQVSKLLKIYHLYIQAITFLLLIPNWNQIMLILKQINLQYFYRQYNEQQIANQMVFLNRLMKYAKQRNKMAIFERIQEIVNQYLGNKERIISQSSKKQQITNNYQKIQSEKRSEQKLAQNWYYSYIYSLYSKPYGSGRLSLASIVQKVRAKQQTKDVQQITRLNKTNQLLYLLSKQYKK